MGTSAVQVATANGRIEGLQFDRHQAFLGIPFAAPPTGPRRFCAPAARRGRGAVSVRQTRSPTRRFRARVRCRAPPRAVRATRIACISTSTRRPRTTRKRPVFFWIHGGGFTLGSGSEPLYDGWRLATARRHRGGDDPLPSRRARLSVSRRSRRRQMGRHRKRGSTRSDRCARMGARQHRGVRRRSRTT